MSAKTYKIYINQATLFITEDISAFQTHFQQLDSELFDFAGFYERVKSDIQPMLYVLQTANAKRFFKNMKASITFIKAAGGVVRNEENKYLFIFRKGKWDLPKGKLDENEKPKKAAVREVEEECGIKVSKLDDKLCNSYHAYQENGAITLKKTSWYKMEAKNGQELVPQTEEDITEVRWVATADFDMIRSNTYPLIADVIDLLV